MSGGDKNTTAMGEQNSTASLTDVDGFNPRTQFDWRFGCDGINPVWWKIAHS